MSLVTLDHGGHPPVASCHNYDILLHKHATRAVTREIRFESWVFGWDHTTVMNYRGQLSKYKNEVLNQVCIVCGFTIKTKKADKVESIVNGMQAFSGVPRRVNILAIDVGLKNLSYCKISGLPGVGEERPQLELGKWKKLNLHERYGTGYRLVTNDMESLIDSKRYMSFLSYLLIKDVILGQAYVPDVIVIENQRTRSNNLLSTLPNVLMNYTFENMVYSSFLTAQQYHPELRKTIVTPMNASKMIHFWINRFAVCPKGLQTKKLRIQLFFEWITAQEAPFSHNFDIPDGFGDLSPLQKSKYLLNLLGLPALNNKIDDLIDSLLYGLTSYKLLKNQHKLRGYLDGDGDLSAFVDDVNSEHFSLIKKVVVANDLELIDKPKSTKVTKGNAKTRMLSPKL